MAAAALPRLRCPASRRARAALLAAVPVLAAVALRGFALEPFEVASESMLPTLEAGDRLFVNKLRAPQRGDLVVFERGGARFVKRVIALPGERVAVRGGCAFVNGVPAEEWSTGTLHVDAAGRALAGRRERIGGVEHALLDDPDATRDAAAVVVPEGHYFVLGDNRDHSEDSRDFGAIPREAIVGVVTSLWGRGPRFEQSRSEAR